MFATSVLIALAQCSDIDGSAVFHDLSPSYCERLQTVMLVDRYFVDGGVLVDLLSGKQVTVTNGSIAMSGANRLEAHDYRLYKRL